MTTDPNWLYSTIAQSSAAIVAIVGGFITATVLSLAAEKRSLNHRLSDMNARLSALTDEEHSWHVKLQEMRVESFLNDTMSDLIKEANLPPFEELVKRYPYISQLNMAILQKEYELLLGYSRQRLEAKAFVENHSDKIDPKNPVLFGDWVTMNELDVSQCDHEILAKEYDNLLTRKKNAEKGDESYILWAAIPPLESIRDETQRHFQRELHDREREGRRWEEAKKSLSNVRHEILVTKSETESIKVRLGSFSYPPNLGWGVTVLAFLSVLGILLPVLILAYEAFFTWAKVLATVSFWIGIIAVFAYIVLQTRILRRK